MSGRKTEKDRPGFAAMLKAAHQRKFDIVVFWALDRLSREGTRATEVLQLCSYSVIGWRMLLLDSSVCGLFKWRQFEPEVILLAVGWYLRFSLSYRDVEELLAERGLPRRSRHSLEVGPALRPGTGAATAPTAQGNQRL